MLAENLPLDFNAKDKLGRPVRAVASIMCNDLLLDIGKIHCIDLQILRYFPLGSLGLAFIFCA